MTTLEYRRRQQALEAWQNRMAWRLLLADCVLLSLGAIAIAWAVLA